MKKRTLNQTWTLCLRMWRWIAKVWQTPRYRRYSVLRLKSIWLKKNGFNSIKIKSTCFFCDYALEDRYGDPVCDTCPGYLVDDAFECISDDYYYRDNPVGFYNKLLQLNRIRKAKK